ncbi:hypothetical protein WBP07_20690 (plasmid) [Novosphingobium sp. BL-8A]|uniref:hypothetical protein n=1 Tax=Novosphingobium sp. BL-8A TaxID=3127639 RepID=UPI0037582A02
MDNVNIFLAGKQIATNTPFLRAPSAGELIQLRDGWYKVDRIGHSWTNSGPVMLVDVVKGHTTEGYGTEGGETPFPEFPATYAPEVDG